MREYQSFARQCESWVQDRLTHQGWNCLAKNYRRPGCEIDLILQRHLTICIVEVKGRRHFSNDVDSLVAMMSYKKKLALKRGALHYLTEYDPEYSQVIFVLAVVEQKKPTDEPAFHFYFDQI